MTKQADQTREERLEDITLKQKNIIELITDIKDKYSEYQESGLLLSNLKNASDQINKITLLIATDETSKTLIDENKTT